MRENRFFENNELYAYAWSFGQSRMTDWIFIWVDSRRDTQLNSRSVGGDRWGIGEFEMSWALRRQCEEMLNICIRFGFWKWSPNGVSNWNIMVLKNSLSISAFGRENVTIYSWGLIFNLHPKFYTIYVPQGSQQES